eukprot:scaffold117180_cov62-Phaeocystis_antarctica.AAC.8
MQPPAAPARRRRSRLVRAAENPPATSAASAFKTSASALAASSILVRVRVRGRALDVSEADVHLLLPFGTDAFHPHLVGLVHRKHRVRPAVADVHLVGRGARGPKDDAGVVDADDRFHVLDDLEILEEGRRSELQVLERHSEAGERVELRDGQDWRRAHRQRDDGRSRLHDIPEDVGEDGLRRRDGSSVGGVEGGGHALCLSVLEALHDRHRHAADDPEERAAEDEGGEHHFPQPLDRIPVPGYRRVEIFDAGRTCLLVLHDDVVQGLELVQRETAGVVRVDHLEKHPATPGSGSGSGLG